MISPLVRRVANHHKKTIISRCVLVTANSSLSSPQRAFSLTHTQPRLSQHQISTPLQALRMVSNSANKRFSREHLFDCKGRVALVTGGGSGIGLMITQALIANGAKVYITGRTTEKLDRVVQTYSEGQDTIIPIQADITSKEDIKKLVNTIESKESKGLHILVNNAGISGSTLETSASSAEEAKKNLFDAEVSTFEDWTSVYQTNVSQLFFMTTALLPLLAKASESERGWSSTVLNITSISGLVKSSQHHFQYNASKAAANHLTRMLATEIASENGIRVRINAIAPGVFPSEMTAGESRDDQKSELDVDKFKNKVPARRPGRDEDMAQAALNAVCNQYINGEVMVVDGGYTIAAGK
ncbi:hypothetical protein F5B22DRAFT_634012 [Xylaria bambusicola]|uniref:uncharacterized protein n=1 Tax=Xylaria bambusicola TaxID=326684 RepID=UPI0020088883|nr:uncharacterized protein F5B22DRAFT_634012 [Xylaria bambusicola]KAI0522058.1 hypothetical protein F5B22DRAFT_634012 [Xylaria bambusicola]